MANARITGVLSAVPESFVDGAHFAAIYGATDAARIDKLAGLDRRPRLPAHRRPIELAEHAARELLSRRSVDPESVDALLYVTQTPEFKLPATACMLQDRLGASRATLALDVNLGCSGYVHGLSLAAALVRSGMRKRVLLVAGDCVSRLCDDRDRSTAPLFGDAYSATLVETAETDGFGPFQLGTDGSGWRHLLVPVGQQTWPSLDSFHASVHDLGAVPHPACLHMNGDEIFSFTLARVPGLVADVLAASARTIAEIDAFVYHQANGFLLEHLRKRSKIPPEKMLSSIAGYGNTSSASIPVTLCARVAGGERGRLRACLVGFGVGFSWGATVAEIDTAAVFPVATLRDGGPAVAR